MCIEDLINLEEPLLLNAPFRLGNLVAAGGMGIVYELLDKEDLLVKLVHPGLFDQEAGEIQLKHEAEIEMALTGTPQIVETLSYAVGPTGRGYKIMKRMSGEALKVTEPKYIAAAPALMQQLFDVVNTLHQEGVIHGDIKPSNVHVDSTGQIILFDFGLSRRLNESPLEVPASYIAHTLYYSSPEVLSGQIPTMEDDFYSIEQIYKKLKIITFPARGEVMSHRY